MVFLISLVLASVFALTCDKALKKYPQIFYIGATVISLFFVIFDFPNTNAFVKNYILAIFQKGTLATALFVLVMFAGALKNGSYLIKKLMPIRAELSIIASILILIHSFNFGKIYIVRLFTSLSSMPALQILFAVLSIAMLVIMIPLAVISFKKIRKKMNAKLWKKIQRFAYGFYGLIYIHILIAYIPSAQRGNTKNIINVIIYSIVFITYAVMRIRKAVLKKRKDSAKTVNISFGSAGAVAMAVICALVFVPYANNIKNASEPVSYTTPPTNSDSQKNITNNTSSAVESVSNVNSKVSSENTVSEKISDTDKKSSDSKSVKSESKSESTKSEKSSDSDKKASDSEKKSSDTQSRTESKSASSVESKTEDKDEEQISQNTEVTEEQNNYQSNEQDNNQQNNETTNNEPENIEESPAEEPVQEPEEEPVQTVYRDGVYEAKRYAYDGYVYVTIVIENDQIVSIDAYSDESDLWYFDQANDVLVPAILDQQRTDLDAVSGATFSSNGIMGAVEDALKKALNED